MTDLLLVGSKHIYRQALALIVAYEMPDCCVRAQASTSVEALTLLMAGIPADLAIVDLDERVGDPLDLITQMRLHRPDLALIALVDAAPGSCGNYVPASSAVQLIDKGQPLSAILERIHHLCQSPSSPCAEDAAQADRYHSAR